MWGTTVISRIIFASAFGAAAFFSTLGTAQAGLEFCNKTDVTASVAIGYKGDQGWTSEGWWNVDAGDCKTVVSGDLDKSHYYWRAESSGNSWSHAKFMFCTSEDEFTIVGDADCDGRGYAREGFNEIKLEGKTAFTMNLTPAKSSASSGKSASVVAGPSGDPEENIVYPDEPEEYDSAASDVVTDPPGTHGEPYSITGILSHCDVLDAGIQCTVVADGWLYTADSYSPTPMPLLEEMLNSGTAVPITISGDLMDYAGRQANVTIREYQLGYADAFSAERDLMQGFWRSVDDPSYEVTIYGTSFEEYYGGAPDLMAFMTYQWGCDSAFDGQIAFQLVSWDGNEQRCFAIEYMDTNEMSIWAAGTMAPMTFRRAQ